MPPLVNNKSYLTSEATEMGMGHLGVAVLEAVVGSGVAELERRRDCRAGGRRYMGSGVAVWRSSSGGGVTVPAPTGRQEAAALCPICLDPMEPGPALRGRAGVPAR